MEFSMRETALRWLVICDTGKVVIRGEDYSHQHLLFCSALIHSFEHLGSQAIIGAKDPSL